MLRLFALVSAPVVGTDTAPVEGDGLSEEPAVVDTADAGSFDWPGAGQQQ